MMKLNPASRLATTALIALSSFLPINSPVKAVGFQEQEINQSLVIAVARPYGEGKFDLLVLEQIPGKQQCWSESGDNPALIQPLLLNFDFTGICRRATDSNGYSIRLDGQDLGLDYLLRVVPRNGELVLIGTARTGNFPEIVVGKTKGLVGGFMKIQLNPGWQFTRRTYNGKALGHYYFSASRAVLENNAATTTPTAPANGKDSTPAPTEAVPPQPVPPEAVPSQPVPPEAAPASTPQAAAPNPAKKTGNQANPDKTSQQVVAPSPADKSANQANTKTNFNDISRNPYQPEIEVAVKLGFVNGFEDGSFRPQGQVTREQFISMVVDAIATIYPVNLAGKPQRRVIAFRDVPDSRWSAKKIKWAQGNFLTISNLGDTLLPTERIGRAELMEILRGLAIHLRQHYKLAGDLPQTQKPVKFSDTAKHPAEKVISQMSGYCGVATPFNEKGTAFAPNAKVTRDYATAALTRTITCVQSEAKASGISQR